MIGCSLVSSLVVICGFRVSSLHSANPLLINKTMPEFMAVFIHLDDQTAKAIFGIIKPYHCSFAPGRGCLGMLAPHRIDFDAVPDLDVLREALDDELETLRDWAQNAALAV